MNALIVTADDFGLATEVNEAVERANREGVLSAASLMVSGAAAAQAIALARSLPSLRVGLHLVLVEGIPASPPEHIPDLVDASGRLRGDMVRLAVDIALRPNVRRQLRREIVAQFEAFGRTGLPLDHVNAHKHFHVHPLIAREVLMIGREYGMRALRVPHEPADVISRVETAPLAPSVPPFIPAKAGIQGNIPDAENEFTGSPLSRGRTAHIGAMAPWNAWLRVHARRVGLTTPDAVFGLRFTGAMTAGRLRGLLENLPNGLVEIYTHPATSNIFAGHAAGYRYTDELQALTDPAVTDALHRSGRRVGGFTDASLFAAITSRAEADSLSARTSGSRR